MFCEFRSGVEISDAECWSSAALSNFCERNLESECFQNFHSGHANMWFVITHKCVVPKDDRAALSLRRSMSAVVAAVAGRGSLAGVTARGSSVLREPFVESFACVMGQRSLRGDSKRRFHQSAQRLKIED